MNKEEWPKQQEIPFEDGDKKADAAEKPEEQTEIKTDKKVEEKKEELTDLEKQYGKDVLDDLYKKEKGDFGKGQL